MYVLQHVMRFAEVTQEVQVARPQGPVFDIGLTPGRRRMKMQRQELRYGAEKGYYWPYYMRKDNFVLCLL